MTAFRIVSVNISREKGTVKTPVNAIALRPGHGVVGDAHAGPGHRQVSLLAQEDVDVVRTRGADVRAGDFAENITTQGIDLASLPVGAHLAVGSAEIEVTQIGKTCHRGCAIMRQVGDCIMPRRGIFARVVKEGEVSRESAGHYDI